MLVRQRRYFCLFTQRNEFNNMQLINTNTYFYFESIWYRQCLKCENVSVLNAINFIQKTAKEVQNYLDYCF